MELFVTSSLGPWRWLFLQFFGQRPNRGLCPAPGPDSPLSALRTVSCGLDHSLHPHGHLFGPGALSTTVFFQRHHHLGRPAGRQFLLESFVLWQTMVLGIVFMAHFALVAHCDHDFRFLYLLPPGRQTANSLFALGHLCRIFEFCHFSSQPRLSGCFFIFQNNSTF